MKATYVWTGFVLCLTLVLAAMTWSSLTVLRLERAERAAKAQALLEENVRLALWRLDSSLTPLVAQESTRPYFEYSSFHRAESAYAEMFGEFRPGDALVPSTLLRDTPSAVLLHFQFSPDGSLASPQVPAGALQGLAEKERHATAAKMDESRKRLDALKGRVTAEVLHARLPRQTLRPGLELEMARAAKELQQTLSQKLKSTKEFEARQSVQATNFLSNEPRAASKGAVNEGAMAPVWIGDALLLARRVRVNGATYLQGCWLDWPRLRRELCASIADLLPQAQLEPVADAAPSADDERRLAALPIRLVPGPTAEAPAYDTPTPLRWSLIGAWVSVVVAAVSVAALLAGVMTLSERRRIFVSAVTHELRTPLTTFRLYTEMMDAGMVSGEEKRREYISRLRAEAERLGHLVENVLFYSRLEGGRAGATREKVDLRGFLQELSGRLRDRAQRAGMELAIDEDEGIGAVDARIDRSAVEQILLNLVDNACKYAGSATPPMIEIRLGRRDDRAVIRVRDHGPGISKADRQRLFRPFSKSDREAATSAPGVGLGLALSRRLARAQGGDLRLDESVKLGAGFLLTLPPG